MFVRAYKNTNHKGEYTGYRGMIANLDPAQPHDAFGRYSCSPTEAIGFGRLPAEADEVEVVDIVGGSIKCVERWERICWHWVQVAPTPRYNPTGMFAGLPYLRA